MNQPAFAPFPDVPARAVPLRTAPLALRQAGRKARLSGVTSGDAMAALIAALPAALGQRMRFHEPTAREQSFDELWLANALDAVQHGDTDRYKFAMLSRMSREQASRLHFLMCRAAQGLDKT